MRVIHDVEGLRKEASNHWVTLSTDEGGAEHVTCSGVPASPRVATREHCGETWPLAPRLSAGGRALRYWWLCPNECNLSSQYAVSRLRAMGDGRVPLDPIAGRRYLDFLLSRAKPKHKVPLDAYDLVRDREALMELFSAEWTPELNAAYDGFD